MSVAVDLVVVGGGVIGASAALEGARRGLRVAVVEAAEPGAASAVSGGMLAPSAEAECVEPALSAAMRASCAMYPDFVADLERGTGIPCGYRREGALLVARHRDDWEELEHLARAQHRLDLPCVRLSADEVRAREPGIAPRQVGGLWAESDRQVDPVQLLRALRRALAASEAIWLQGHRALELLTGPDGAAGLRVGSATGERFEVRAPAVLVAAGAWSAAVFPQLGYLPLRPVRGQSLRLGGAVPLRHVVRGPDVYLVPRGAAGGAAGIVFVGASSEERGFDLEPSAGVVLELLRRAWELVPGIAEMVFEGTHVGLRPALRDPLPAIGPSGYPGLFVATGHYRHGISLAPWTAHRIVEAIAGPVPPELGPFLPARFARGPAAHRGADS